MIIGLRMEEEEEEHFQKHPTFTETSPKTKLAHAVVPLSNRGWKGTTVKE